MVTSVPVKLLPSHRTRVLLSCFLDHSLEISANINRLVVSGMDNLEDINFDQSFEQIESELKFLIDLLPEFSDQMLAHLLRLLQNLDEQLQTACSRLEFFQQVLKSSPTLAVGIRSQ